LQQLPLLLPQLRERRCITLRCARCTQVLAQQVEPIAPAGEQGVSQRALAVDLAVAVGLRLQLLHASAHDVYLALDEQVPSGHRGCNAPWTSTAGRRAAGAALEAARTIAAVRERAMTRGWGLSRQAETPVAA
jgi:hypothetical protein